MFEGDEDIRRALRGLGDELSRAMDQAGRVVRQALDDMAASRPARPPRDRPPTGPPPGERPAAEGDPVVLIRRLGELRDAGYITDEEFQQKKRDLLGRIA